MLLLPLPLPLPPMLSRRAAVPALAAAACLAPCLLRSAVRSGCWNGTSGTGSSSVAAPPPPPKTERTPEARAAKKERQRAVLEERRLARNQLRSKRGRANRSERKANERAERQATLDAMSTEERERHVQEQREKKAEREARQAAQEELVRTALASDQRICIDLSFDAEMTEKENRSLAKQVELSTVANKNATCPVALTITSFEETSRFGQLLQGMAQQKWPLNIETQPAWEAYGPEQIVYLTPDAPNVLTELDPEKVYCIGGLVDRQVSRHMTVNHAAEQGVATTARLPLREHCRMHNNALNIDTVVKILLEFRACGDWKQALETVVPQRRRVTTKPAAGGSDAEPGVAAKPVDDKEVKSKWLWVGGIPLGDSACAAAATEACISCGATSVDFAPEERNYGFVQFETEDAAEAAKPNLHRRVRGSIFSQYFALALPTDLSSPCTTAVCSERRVSCCLCVLHLVQDVPKLSGAKTKLRVQWAKEPLAAQQ